MNKRRSSSLWHALHWGALEIAGIYLIIGVLWILFSDQIAARVALNEEMLTTISLSKGWAYVLITALLLYGLIQRHTARLQAGKMQLQRVLDALPALISYIDKDQHYRFTNSAYQDWFEGQTLGKHIQEVVGTSAYQSALKYIDKVLGGETVRYETEMFLPGGERFISAIYVPDIGVNGQVEGFFTLVHDVTEQKQTLEERRLWADAFEGCADGIAIGDPNTNRIVVCNPAFAKLHKSRVEDIVGSAILSLYAASDHEHVRRNVQKADQIGHARFEAKMTRRGKDSSTFPVEMDVVSILGEDGEILHRVVTAQDISERKQAQEKLKESETKYRILVEHLPAITYISEAEQYMGVSYVSPQIESLGFDVNTWLADPEFWFRQIHPDDQERVQSELQRFKGGAESFKTEYRLVLPTGETRWFHDESIRVQDQDGKTLLKQGFMMDITEYKQAEEKLQLQARWLDQINDAVITSNTNLVITAWNPAAERIYGWRAEEVIGKKGEELLRSEFFNKTRAEVLRELSESGEFSAEITQLRKDGARIHIETRTVTLRDENGHAIGYVSVNRDITERKQAEQENISLARFPAENPNPVMRASHKGTIIYANEASEPLLLDWHAKVGDSLPEDWIQLIQEIIQTGSGKTIDIQCGEKTYSIMIVYAPDANDVNIYGRDITERKRMEEALRRSEALLLQTGEMAKIGGWELDLQTMTLFWSREIYRIHEIDTFDQPDLESAINYYTEEARPVVRAAVQRAIEDGQLFSFELPMVTAKGRPIWVRAMGQSEARNGRYVRLFGTLQDITERKQGEEYLRRFELLSKHSRDIILFMGHKDGRILEANAAAWQTYGYSRDELLDLTTRDLRAPHTLGLTAEQMAQADAGGILFETIHRRKDGITFPVEVSSQGATINGVRTLISIVRDISERRKAEEALRQSEQRLKRAQEIAHLGSWELDHVNNRLTWSDEVYRIFGLQPQEFAATYEAFLEAVHPDDRSAVDAAYSDSIQAGRDSYEIEHRVIDQSSRQVRIVHEKCEHFRNADGQVFLSVGMVHDITERKNAEKALTESESRFRSLFEQSADAQLLLENGIFTDCNPATVQMMRAQSKEEILSSRPSELSPEYQLDGRPSSEKADGLIRIALENGSNRFEWIHRRKDGTEFPVEVLLTSISTGDRQVVHAVWRDITERKRAEEALRLKDQLLHLTSEMAKVGGWEFDPVSGKGTWTDEVARIHDLDPAQATNVEIGLSFYIGESRKKIEQAVTEAIELGKPYDLELEMITAPGNHKWARTMALPIMQDGKVVKVQGIFQDITERKQIEQALQAAHDELEIKVQERTAALSEANALLQALMDNLPDHIYFKDTQSRFIRNSRSQASLLGLNDPSEATGKTDFDFFPHAARSYAEEQEIMRSGKPLVDFEEWVVWPDGRETWVLTTKLPLRNSEGQTIGIFGISHDITERKRAEQAIYQLNADLEKQTEQLQAANKELEAFSYSVSHDLRAPLRAIDGYTRILVEDYESILDDEGKRVCGVISREARRMGQLIDDLLAFSRLGRKEMFSSKIEMRTLVVSVLNDLLKQEERGRVDIHIANLHVAKGDASLIRQVWVNLLANAIKFTSQKERAVIEVGGKATKDELIYYVRDNGAGFEMEYVNKLFGVFQRLHSESEFSGTGVGLAIVQRIIHRHDGRVWAEGEVEKGATFYFALPRKENPS